MSHTAMFVIGAIVLLLAIIILARRRRDRYPDLSAEAINVLSWANINITQSARLDSAHWRPVIDELVELGYVIITTDGDEEVDVEITDAGERYFLHAPSQ